MVGTHDFKCYLYAMADTCFFAMDGSSLISLPTFSKPISFPCLLLEAGRLFSIKATTTMTKMSTTAAATPSIRVVFGIELPKSIEEEYQLTKFRIM